MSMASCFNPLEHFLKMPFASLTKSPSLGKLARMSKLKKSGNKSRTELLRMLAEHFEGEHFVAVVLGQHEKAVKLDSGLIENVFEGMDDDERQEFRELQSKVKKAQKQSVQERWWKFLEEKKKEVQAPCHSVKQDSRCDIIFNFKWALKPWALEYRISSGMSSN